MTVDDTTGWTEGVGDVLAMFAHVAVARVRRECAAAAAAGKTLESNTMMLENTARGFGSAAADDF